MRYWNLLTRLKLEIDVYRKDAEKSRNHLTEYVEKFATIKDSFASSDAVLKDMRLLLNKSKERM